MENAIIYKSGVERLMELCKDTFGDRFKAYYEGDPGLIPKDYYPCVIIEKMEGAVDVAGTGQDEMTEVVSIRLVRNKQLDLEADDQVDLSERLLRRDIEARNPDTGFFMEGTLMYALRTRLTLENLTIGNTVNVQYGTINRRDNWSSEGMVKLILTERLTLPVDRL